MVVRPTEPAGDRSPEAPWPTPEASPRRLDEVLLAAYGDQGRISVWIDHDGTFLERSFDDRLTFGGTLH